ncbi:MAG: hypothetical protein IT447_04500 [Phycisphaerales bacterium]|nr:hypothetical protein [Phycisphaerales bacterium]
MIATLAEHAPLFIRPLPVWNVWWLLMLPLCIGVAIVYKSIKCHSMKSVPREATVIAIWIILGMVAAAAALAGLMHFIDR